MSFIENGERIVAVTVSDSLNPQDISERVSEICRLAETHGSLKAVCIRNDSRSSQRFEDAVCQVTSGWGGAIILQSSDMPNISASALNVMGRPALIMCNDPCALQVADIASSALGMSLAVTGKDVEELVNNVETCESDDIVIIPPADDIKGCLDQIEDLRRLHKDHGIDEAGNPIGVIVRSGEYAVSVASVAFHSGASLVVFDHVDPVGCTILDALIGSL
jgi:CO dehydrogenase/acetyl-CoA synthase gamma subunit (corrinoid Fe-S protein)